MYHDITRQGMLSAVDDFAQEIQEGDDVIVYLAGHGHSYNGDLYMVPAFSDHLLRCNDAENEERLDEICISMKKLKTIIAKRKPRLKLFILDSCNSNMFHIPTLRKRGSLEIAGDCYDERGSCYDENSIGENTCSIGSSTLGDDRSTPVNPNVDPHVEHQNDDPRTSDWRVRPHTDLQNTDNTQWFSDTDKLAQVYVHRSGIGQNFFTLFAAAPGTKALEGRFSGGLFTRSLIYSIRMGGMTLSDCAETISERLKSIISNFQRPFANKCLTDKALLHWPFTIRPPKDNAWQLEFEKDLHALHCTYQTRTIEGGYQAPIKLDSLVIHESSAEDIMQ